MTDIFRDSIFWVEVDRIQPNPFQPRREFDEKRLQELAESIRMYGLLQPITVTRSEEAHEDGSISVSYELIAGERRLRASKLAGLSQIPVIIRTGEESKLEKLELAIIENLQREDLNAVDRARAFDRLSKEFGLNFTQIGEKMGKSREYVSNTVRILALPEYILSHIAGGRMAEGHSRPLLMINNHPEEQEVLVKEILVKKISVRDSEAYARRIAQDKVKVKEYKIDPEILSLERALTQKLGTRVTIHTHKGKGGRLMIDFFSAGDLQMILDTMRISEEVTLPDKVTVPPTEVLCDEQVEDLAEATQLEFLEESTAEEKPVEVAEISFEDGQESPKEEVLEILEVPLVQKEEEKPMTIEVFVITDKDGAVKEVFQEETNDDLYTIRDF